MKEILASQNTINPVGFSTQNKESQREKNVGKATGINFGGGLQGN